jgi:asparagine synthase (glutamine-hydrolysing)
LARALRDELREEGVERGADGGAPDVALLAAAVRRWGGAAPRHLLGDFAFVAWDAAAGRLLAACDPAAARPLCWAVSGEAVHFASSPAALAAHPAVGGDLDEAAAAAFLALDFRPVGRTLWRAVHKLRPGHRLCFALPPDGSPPAPLASPRDGRLREERWWRPEDAAPLSYRRDEEYADHFGEVLERAVGERLRRVAGAPAVLLSGGLDSSAVTAVAADLAARGAVPAAPVAVSHTFPTFAACDELRHASAVAARWGLPLAAVDAERDLVPTAPTPELAELEPAVWAQQRFSAPLFGRAAELGAGAVLTGFGGDALFDAARWSYVDDLHRGRWWRLGPWIVDRRRRGASWPRAVAAVVLKPLLPPVLAAARSGRLPSPSRRRLPPWVAPRLAAAMKNRPAPVELPPRLPGRARRAQWRHLVELAQQAAAIEGLAECGAKRALPVFHPLLDRRLAELVLAAPLRLGARPAPAGSKHLLRAALGDRLPEAVRRRDDKTGWGPYLAHLLRGPTGAAASALLRGGRLAALGWVDEGTLVGELERFRRGAGSPLYGHGLPFLPPLLLELWLRARRQAHPGRAPAGVSIRHPEAPLLRRAG